MSMALPPLPPRRRTPYEVIAPNLGLYLGRSALEIPDRGFADCLNVRIKDRKITNHGIGWLKVFQTSLGNQVLLVDLHRSSVGVNTTIFGTKTDLFRYDELTNLPVYITPTYTTGTLATTDASDQLVGTATAWLTSGIKAGDKIHIGSAAQTAVAATWYTVESVDSNTAITLVENYSGTTAGGKAYTARLLFTATDLDWWDTDIFPDAPMGPESALPAGDHWYGTNGSELVVWDGSAAQVKVLSTALTGLGFACKTLCYFKNMMLFGNITEGASVRPSSFKNSAIADPENVTTLEANEQIMAQSVDFLLAMRRLGDYVVGYCEGSVNIAQFVESPFYFAIRTAAPRIGVFGARTIINFGDYHEFLAKDQAYRFDGVRLIPFGNQVFDDVLQRVDRERSEKALASISEEEREVYWVLPLVSDGADEDKGCEIAWVEHYAEQAGNAPTPFTKRELPATAMGNFRSSPLSRFSDFAGVDFSELNQPWVTSYFSAGFPVLLFGDEDGYIYTLGIQTGKDVEGTLVSYVKSPTRPLADGNSIGIVRRVEPYLERDQSSTEDIDITVITSDRVVGPESYEDSGVDLDQQGQRFAPHRRSGRYASVLFSTAAASADWTMQGYRVLTEVLGER